MVFCKGFITGWDVVLEQSLEVTLQKSFNQKVYFSKISVLGLFVTYFGSKATFRGYGIISIFVLAAFVFINFYRKEQGFISDIPTTEDPHQVCPKTQNPPLRIF